MYLENSNLPNIINHTLPALEKVTTSADLGLDIATLNPAREAFIKAQTSEKIKNCINKSKLNKHKKDFKSAWKYTVNVIQMNNGKGQ